jgi:hypothetical protein
MDKLTTGLIAVAAAIGLVALRDARQRAAQAAPQGSGTSSLPPARPQAGDIDPGMVILRNDHIDDGIAVQSPFKGDPGIVAPRSGEQSSPAPSKPAEV